jgi:hypothetical protein
VAATLRLRLLRAYGIASRNAPIPPAAANLRFGYANAAQGVQFRG